MKPALILVWQNIQAIYPLLSQISPTAIIPWRGRAAWREHFQFVAKALGKEKQAQQAWKHPLSVGFALIERGHLHNFIIGC